MTSIYVKKIVYILKYFENGNARGCAIQCNLISRRPTELLEISMTSMYLDKTSLECSDVDALALEERPRSAVIDQLEVRASPLCSASTIAGTSSL